VQKSSKADRCQLERRRSGPATLQSRIQKTRNNVTVPPIRFRPSYPPFLQSRSRSDSNSTGHSSEHFIDDHTTQGSVNQPSAMLQGIRQDLYSDELGATLNVAVIDHTARAAQIRRLDESIQGPSHRNWATSSTQHALYSDRTTNAQSQSTTSDACLTSSSAEQDSRIQFYDSRERERQQMFAQNPSSHTSRNLHHQRNPALNGRSALRDTYPVASRYNADEDILEDVELEIQQGSHHGSQNGSHQSSKNGSQVGSDGIYRHLSQGSSTFSNKRTRHSSEMGQYFQFGSSSRKCRSPTQQQQQTSQSYTPHSYTQRPRPSQTPSTREPLNRNPIPTKQRSARISRRTTGAPDTILRVVHPSPPVSAPTNKRWHTRVFDFFSTQPNGARPNTRGDPFLTKLQHDIAPIHWLLRILQFTVWVAIFGVYMWQTWTSHRKLAFDCYELKMQLSSYQGKSDPQGYETSSTESTSVAIPPQYIVHGKMSAALCVLTPAVPETALFDNFRARWIIGIMCVGFANLLQVLLFMTLAKTMKTSGAHGNRTLLIRVFAGVLAAMVGSAAIMKWAGLVLGFSD
jgi:hypothetical protein